MMWLTRTSIALLFAALQLSSCNTNTVMQGSSLKDKDWNTSFTSNCPLPHYDSIRWISKNDRRYARFTLSDGDKGGCVADRVARHSGPYWERAELKQIGTLNKKESHSITATLRFVEGFSGDRETFFQIHAYNKRCKQAYPPIMIKFDSKYTDGAVLTLNALQGNKRHISYRSDVRIDDILGDWIELNLKLDAARQNIESVSMNGETLFSDIPFWNEACGDLHIKFGVYRPGSLSGNVKSTVDFDSINVN